jgi:chromosome segregation ATPase
MEAICVYVFLKGKRKCEKCGRHVMDVNQNPRCFEHKESRITAHNENASHHYVTKNSKIDALDEHIAKQQEMINALIEKNAKLSEENRNLRCDLETISKRCNSMKNTLSELRCHCKKVEEEVLMLKKENDIFRQRIESCDEAKKLCKEVSELKIEVESKSLWSKALEEKLGMHSSRIAAVEKMINDLPHLLFQNIIYTKLQNFLFSYTSFYTLTIFNLINTFF